MKINEYKLIYLIFPYLRLNSILQLKRINQNLNGTINFYLNLF
jgi:hypothetical protein